MGNEPEPAGARFNVWHVIVLWLAIVSLVATVVLLRH